jgi:hypothetical protein
VVAAALWIGAGLGISGCGDATEPVPTWSSPGPSSQPANENIEATAEADELEGDLRRGLTVIEGLARGWLNQTDFEPYLIDVPPTIVAAAGHVRSADRTRLTQQTSAAIDDVLGAVDEMNQTLGSDPVDIAALKVQLKILADAARNALNRMNSAEP